MKHAPGLLVLALAALTQGRDADAAITYVATVDNAGQSGTTTYGTDGYDLYSTSSATPHTGNTDYTPFGLGERLTRLPSYVSSVTANGVYRSGQGYSYALIIDPESGELVQSGYTFRTDGTPGERTLININLTGSVPSSFFIGIMADTDTNDLTGFSVPDGFRLSGLAGADSGLIAAGGDVSAGVDFYFFEVSGGSAGQTLTLSALENQHHPNSSDWYNTHVPGIVFTQNDPRGSGAVPEPSTLALWAGLGAMGLMAAWRRRKRQAA